MLNIIKTLPIIILVLFTSCGDPEKPVVINVNTDLTTVSVNLTSSYQHQIYFDLATYEEVSRNYKTDWDLGLQKHNDEIYVSLNSSRAMYAVPSDLTFDEIITSDGLTMQWDKPSGEIDSFAISNNLNTAYVIDKGYDIELSHMGFKKIEFVQSGDVLTLNSSDLDGSNTFSQTLTVNDALQITPISLSGSVAEDLFSESTDWDLQFTQYTHEFDAVTPYLVTGVLLNPNSSKAILDTIHTFDEIDYNVAENTEYTSEINTIGYDWKNYSLDAGSYTIKYNNSYIVSTTNGEYYKLRFTDFYDDQGNLANLVSSNSKNKTWKTNYTYNTNNILIARDSYNPKGEYFGIKKTYNTDQKLTLQEIFEKDKKTPVKKLAHTYYENGQKKTTTYTEKGKIKYVWNFDCKDEGELLNVKNKNKSTICLKEEIDADGNRVLWERIFNEKGNLTKRKSVFSPDSTLIQVQTFNEDDRLLYEYFTKENGGKKNIGYNKSGQIASETETFINPDKQIIKSTKKAKKWGYTKLYHYTDQMKVSSVSIYDKRTLVDEYIYTFF